MSAAFRIFGFSRFFNLNLFLILCYATLDNILKIINTDDFIDSPNSCPIHCYPTL